MASRVTRECDAAFGGQTVAELSPLLARLLVLALHEFAILREPEVMGAELGREIGEAAPEVFGRLEDEAAEIGLALDGEREARREHAEGGLGVVEVAREELEALARLRRNLLEAVDGGADAVLGR